MSTTSARPERPKLRALTGRVGGQALGGLLGLPRATTRYTVGHVRVPMRDGVQLVADHYAPATSQPVGTLLVRGPYGRRFPFSLVFARIYAARGYHVVLQSVRGTFGSGGVFEPMVNEAADGADTVAWLREQPWFTGRFGTIGLPYLGFTQWALLHDPPPELAAAVITVGPHDFRASVWGTGSFTVNDFLAGAIWFPTRKTPVASGPESASSPRRDGWRGRPPRCRWVSRPGRCSARVRRGSNPGWNTPTATIRSGTDCGFPPRWTASRSRCCSSAAGRTSSCGRRCSSTGTCATGVCTSR